MFPPIINDPEMQPVPLVSREQHFQVALRLQHRPAVGQFPALGQPVNMSIHRKTWHSESLGQDDLRRFVSDPGQRLQRLKRFRNLAPVLLDQQPREAGDRPRFLRPQTAGPDDLLNHGHRHFHHGLRCSRQLEQPRSHQIDTHIRALGREQHRDQQRERITMIQWYGRLWIKFGQSFSDPTRTLLPVHVELPVLRSWTRCVAPWPGRGC